MNHNIIILIMFMNIIINNNNKINKRKNTLNEKTKANLQKRQLEL